MTVFTDLPQHLLIENLYLNLNLKDLAHLSSVNKENSYIRYDLVFFSKWIKWNRPDLKKLFKALLDLKSKMKFIEIISRLNTHIKYAEVATIDSLNYMPAERAFLLAGRQYDLELYEHFKSKLSKYNYDSTAFIKGLLQPYHNILDSRLTQPIDYVHSEPERFQLAKRLAEDSTSDGSGLDRYYSNKLLNSYINFMLLNGLNINEEKEKDLPPDVPTLTEEDKKKFYLRMKDIKDSLVENHQLRHLLTDGKFNKWDDFFNYVITTDDYHRLFNCSNEQREKVLINQVEDQTQKITIDYVLHKEVININTIFSSKRIDESMRAFLYSAPSWALEYYMDSYSLDEILNEMILENDRINFNTLLIFQKYIPELFNERAPELLAKLLVSEPHEVDYLAGRLLRDIPDILPKTRVELIKLSMENEVNLEDAVDISLIINSIHLEKLNINSFD